MNQEWLIFYKWLERVGKLKEFIALLNADAMLHSRQAAQIGQPDDLRRDALADVRFCLSKVDEATKALMEAQGNANPTAAGGFQEGGPAIA